MTMSWFNNPLSTDNAEAYQNQIDCEMFDYYDDDQYDDDYPLTVDVFAHCKDDCWYMLSSCREDGFEAHKEELKAIHAEECMCETFENFDAWTY